MMFKSGPLHHSQLGGPSIPASLAIVGGGIHFPGDGLSHTRSGVTTAKGKTTHTTGPGSQVPQSYQVRHIAWHLWWTGDGPRKSPSSALETEAPASRNVAAATPRNSVRDAKGMGPRLKRDTLSSKVSYRALTPRTRRVRSTPLGGVLPFALRRGIGYEPKFGGWRKLLSALPPEPKFKKNEQ